MIKYVCKNCGSDNIGHDAWAVWNTEYQDWEVQSVFDHCQCLECEAEGNDIEVVETPDNG